jgi:DNA repair protein RAD5
MGSTNIGQRPAKKRRFFLEDEGDICQSDSTTPRLADALCEFSASTTTDNGPSNIEIRSSLPTIQAGLGRGAATQTSDDFDVELFANLVGEPVPRDTIQNIRVAAENNMERAVNMYLDGKWGPTSMPGPFPTISEGQADLVLDEASKVDPQSEISTLGPGEGPRPEGRDILITDPDWRYVGAFGVGAWATRSGLALIRHGETVKIERTKLQPSTRFGRGGKIVARTSNQKGDVITRFTNNNGEEIGRLPRETAEWVSTLVDQNICKFEGICVYAPDRIRVNDTIYLQLRCFLLKEAFQSKAFSDLNDNNRPVRIFEEQESAEEKALRLRQVALVKLFDEINLFPTTINEMTARHKKEGLLRAAEIAELQAKRSQSSTERPNSASESSEEGEEGQKLEQDQLDTLYKKAQSFDFNTPGAEPGGNFAMNLRKYQKQALHWMLGKERDVKSHRQVSMHPLWEEYSWPSKDVDDKPLPHILRRGNFYVNPYSGELSLEFPVQKQNCLGGILADEMGLGKTIEMLSLIHSNKPESVAPTVNGTGSSVNSLPRLLKFTSGTITAPYTTLVVAPTSLLTQWENEAMKASKPGTMKVLVYYGNDKAVDLRSLCCSGIATAVPNIIITSYGVVRSEYAQICSDRGINSAQWGLFSVEFFRVILDEAHYIKNRGSKTARACYELKGVHRWVLTGTPIVNRLEDLFSLVRFLKVEPWSNFSFWKTFITMPFESKDFVRSLNVVQTVLEPLVLRRTKTMKTPDGEALVPLPPRTIMIEEVELSKQEREIYDYIFTRAKRTFNDNVAAGTLLKSYTTIFAQILRLRQTCCHPVLTRNQTIVAEEEDAAAASEDAGGFKDDMDLQELIDRFTVSTQEDIDGRNDPTFRFTTHALKQIQTESSGECPICSEEPMIDPVVTQCWHSACKKCLEAYVNHQTNKGEASRCFSCRETLNPRDVFEVVRHRSPIQSTCHSDLYTSTPPASANPGARISLRRINPLSPTARTSAKIHALMSHLSRLPPKTKSVVFSQFTSFLDLISAQLTRAGIQHLRFDGTMPRKVRANVLAKFNSIEIDDEDEDDDHSPSFRTRRRQTKLSVHREDPSPNVLLISLRAGGVGLNLTSANNVFMMDPWWSFAVEAQAIDRVHRMGQLRDVAVTRFIVKGSIEGRMLKIQERKMMIARSLGLRVGDGAEEERRKERIEELRLLFE